MTNSNGNIWCVLRVLPKKERQAMAHLEELGCTYYFPSFKRFKFQGSIKEAVEVPLFTGYIFVKNELAAEECKLQFIRGTNGLLAVGAQQAHVTDVEIELLKRICKKMIPPEMVSEMVVGEKITIKSGSLKGITGVVTQIMGKHYIFIEIGTTGMILKLNLSENLVERSKV